MREGLGGLSANRFAIALWAPSTPADAGSVEPLGFSSLSKRAAPRRRPILSVWHNQLDPNLVAEREGFEPSVGV